MTQHQFQVEHRAHEHRYVIIDTEAEGGPKVIGEEVYADVASAAGAGAVERVFHHTHVSKEYGGQGLAAVLVRSAVEHATGEGHKIVPVCPYVAGWFKKNADEYGEHAVTVRPEHLQAVQSA